MKYSRVRFTLSPFFVVLCAITTFAQTPSAEEMPRLTNKEVVGMVQAGISSEVIIAKIRVSRCNFDTEPTQLVELKSRGVANEVLQAMIEAPYGNSRRVPIPVQPDKGEDKRTPTASEPASTGGLLPEFGDITEVKDMKKVYVSAPSTEERKMILAELKNLTDHSVWSRVRPRFSVPRSRATHTPRVSLALTNLDFQSAYSLQFRPLLSAEILRRELFSRVTSEIFRHRVTKRCNH